MIPIYLLDMQKIKDLKGKRFGKLTAIDYERIHNVIVWRLLCDCGNEKKAAASNLSNGGTRTCGLCRQSDKERFLSKVDKSSCCWLWKAHKTPTGYGRFMMKGIKNLTAHRASYMLFVGSIPTGMLVCHSCDNPSCVNPEHLWLGSCADNVRDRDQKGRFNNGNQKGERNQASKISDADASNIKRLQREGLRVCDVVQETNISRGIVQSIFLGNTWKHIN